MATTKKPSAVIIRHDQTGRVMRASRAAYDREYSKKGWSIIEDPAPTPARGGSTKAAPAKSGGKGGED